MELKWNDKRTRQFATNIGLVTSNGKWGDNIMACEWTHHISFSPSLIAVCIGRSKATEDNISETKEFGVSLAASDQNIISSIAGNYSGKDVDKIKVLKELGFSFYKGKKINTLMVEGSSMSAECKLMKRVDVGDHPLFIGEVIEISASMDKKPLIYHSGKYWEFGKNIEKPPLDYLEKIENIVEKFRK